jgi:hypothetical protein
MSVSASETTRSAPSGVRWRAVALALVLIPPNALWVQTMEQVWESGQPTMASLLFNAVFVLLLLAVGSALLRRANPRWALSPADLAVIYGMVCLGTALAGHDQLQVLATQLTYSIYHATPENDWAGLLNRHLPSPLIVSDSGAVRSFWEGGGGLYSARGIAPWLRAGGVWLAFTVLLMSVMLAISAIVQRRWNDEEKLSYPLIELPLALTQPALPALRSRLLWIGFAVAAGINILNGLSFLYPTVPHIQVRCVDLAPRFTTYPWRAMGFTPVAGYPFAIGLGFMMPLDMLFSSWFFFWFWKMQRIISALAGWSRIPRFPFMQEQSFGAYIGVGLFALWAGRRYFAAVARRLSRVWREGGQAGEGLSAERLLLPCALGIAGLVAFASGFGLHVALAVLFFAAYLLLSLAITRMRAEFGVPAHDLYGSGPDLMLVSVLGSRGLGRKSLIMLALFWWFNRAHRSHPMPHGLEALTIGERRGVAPRGMLLALILAAAVGSIAGLWGMLHLGHTRGIVTLPSDSTYLARDPFIRLQRLLTHPTEPSLAAAAAIGIGSALTLSLLALRTRFLWWPFHPVGYAISSSLSMAQLWLPMLIAWALKLITLHYAGPRWYRRSLPFFFGLVLGEFVVGSLWTLVGIAGDFATYRFWAY